MQLSQVKETTDAVVTLVNLSGEGQNCFQEGSCVPSKYYDTELFQNPVFPSEESRLDVSLRFDIDSPQSHVFRNSNYVSLTFPWWSQRGAHKAGP